ncbi:MAG: S24 family peptidase [Campylobacteraceae bacterium]|jgi:phage repressor protein C with HTH and peptisase S24 domain|nr:S24 family peptidase [Campylobacteraceae bacterium]
MGNTGEFNYLLLGELISKYYGSSAKFADELTKQGLPKSEPAIKKWRQNESVPKINELHIIAKLLHVTIADLFVTKNNINITQDKNDSDVLDVVILSHNTSAGTSQDIYDIEVFDTNQTITISPLYFKTPQKAENLRATQVEGYSMLPMLLPDSWIIFDITKTSYDGDGLYVFNWNNILMVKLLQITPEGKFKIISRNPDYESWEIQNENQVVFKIFGKVLKTVF